MLSKQKLLCVNHDEYRVFMNEIFYSIQGESSWTGFPTVFLRLAGCPLRCTYCDTAYAFGKGIPFSFQKIHQVIKTYHTNYITVTGGEPLAQKNTWYLLRDLVRLNYQISLETSGAISIENIPSEVKIVMDWKAPTSGESNRNLVSNFSYLKLIDEVKFVIENEKDFEWMQQEIENHLLSQRVSNILVSPVYEKLTLQELAKWVLESGLPIRLQPQLHKVIWGQERGR